MMQAQMTIPLQKASGEFSQRRILVVDDEMSIQTLLRSFFALQGFAVDAVSSGREAVAAAAAEPYDLVVLDVRMPGMDGYATCRRLKGMERLRNVPILMVTGIDDIETKTLAAESGADDFIAKPLKLNELALRVKSLLRIKSRFDEEEEKKRALGEQNMRKGRLLSIAAHDLRNPLTSIKAYAELIATRHNPEPEVKEYIKDIITSSNFMTELLSDLLDLSRIESGAVDLRLEPVQVRELVRDTLKLMRFEAMGRRLVLEIDDLAVLADGRKLVEILSNLLGNALKYSPEGAPVTVSAHDAGGRVAITVKDEGIGIPEDKQDKLFSPFYRACRSDIAEIPGTGLGLFIVKAFSESMKGTVSVTSARGKGSAFTVTLPAADAPAV